jgi:uncharacterized OB-fold protein
MRDDDFFWEAGRDGRLLVQRCGGCGLVRHPPAPMCARCQSVEVEIVECSGRARVLGWVPSRHPTRPEGDARMVARLQLEEGVYLVANLQGAGFDDIAYGMPVEVFFQEIDGVATPQCRPLKGATA